MSYLGFDDEPGGISVIFYDTPGTTNPANFSATTIATNLSRTATHTAKFVIDFVDGPSNDVVKIYIDGVLVHTGTTWENYFRYDSEASAEQTPRTVDSLLFRAGGTAAPATSGLGFLIDNLSLLSGPSAPSTVTVTIDKFINGAMATTGSANSSAFPMTATWNATNIGAGSGNYDLDADGFNGDPTPYQAITAQMTSGADYTTSEVTGGSVVGATCADGKPYALAGYSSGDSFGAAAAAATSTTAPALTNITSNKYIIVRNVTCAPAVVVPTPVHVSPADNSTLTTAAFDKADWTDVSDAFPPMTYRYESSNSSATNLDGSFTTPVYTSGVLAVSEIPTAGTPAGVYYWHVRAVDNSANMSPWTTAWKVTVDNTPPAPTVPPANACATPGTAPAGYTLQNGTSGNNTVALAPNTMFVGKGGNDTVTGGDGNYIVCTAGGNDTITLGHGNSTVDAGNGNNIITVGNGEGAIKAGGGNDTVVAGDGARTISVGGGNNKVTTGGGAQTITAGGGNDEIRAGAGADTVNAGGGNNKVWGEDGADMLTSAAGNDQLDGGNDTDTCQAGGGNNTKTSCEL